MHRISLDASLMAAVVRLLQVPEAEVQRMLPLLRDPACWFLGDLPGTFTIPLPSPRPSSTTTLFSRALPGALLPHHDHRARESVLVLFGGFRELEGRAVTAGELIVSEPGSAHAIAVDEASDCVCAIRLEFGDLAKETLRDTGLRLTAQRDGSRPSAPLR